MKVCKRQKREDTSNNDKEKKNVGDEIGEGEKGLKV